MDLVSLNYLEEEFVGFDQCNFYFDILMFVSFLFSFKNGSLTRENIRNKCAGSSWDQFNDLLASTPAGNNGNLGKQHLDKCRLLGPYAQKS